MIAWTQHLPKFVIPIVIGIAAFFIVAGSNFLNPFNIAWIPEGDPLQHYLGWALFRTSPWEWPLGLSPKYGMDFSSSIVFTDSIPLLAIPFKAISSILPEPFQYFGLWVLLCFVLQAWFAFKLVGLVSSSLLVRALGTILFVFSPPLIFRMALHESLMGHFLILAGLYLNLRPRDKNQAVWWILLLSVSALIHFYLLLMIFALWISDLFSRVFVKKNTYKLIIFEICIAIFFISIFLWLAGYFAVNVGETKAGGFGIIKTNLLALFNSQGYSYVIPSINLGTQDAYYMEGINYLGAGTLFLLLFAIPVMIKQKLIIRRIYQKHFFLSSGLVFMALISFSHNVGIGPWTFSLELHPVVFDLLSVTRASARFFWPFYYASIFLIIYFIINGYSKKNAYLLLFIAVLIQSIDTSAGWLPKRKIFEGSVSSELRSPLKNSFWNAAGSYYQNVVMDECVECLPFWNIFGIFAAQYGLSTNIVYLARPDFTKMNSMKEKLRKELNSGPLNLKSLYIIRDWQKDSSLKIRYDPSKDLLARIDGFNVLAPGWKVCSTCPPFKGDLEVQENLFREKISFNSQSIGRADYMLGGWGSGEDWGTWALGSKANLIFSFISFKPKKLAIDVRAYINPQHTEQEVEVWGNGSLLGIFKLHKFDGNLIEINLPEQIFENANPDQFFPLAILNLEFRSINPVSPKILGLGGDDRLLGVGLKSIQFMH